VFVLLLVSALHKSFCWWPAAHRTSHAARTHDRPPARTHARQTYTLTAGGEDIPHH
jgi:hypothetical protein